MCNERLWSKFFASLVDAMNDNFEFVHVKIPKDMYFPELSEFLNDYVKEEKAIIIGFSLGGYIAAHFAANFPQRVDSAFIIANSPCALHPDEEKQRQEIVEFINRYGYKGMSKTRAAQLFDTSSWTKSQLEQLVNIMISMDAELGESEFKSQMRYTSKRVDLFEQLVCSQTKLTFYFSEDDALVNSSWLVKLEQAKANCEIKRASGSSHMLPLEKPNELVTHIHEWLSSH